MARFKLLPRLKPGEAQGVDNRCAHHAPRMGAWCRVYKVRLLDLPPSSPDLNSIEPG